MASPAPQTTLPVTLEDVYAAAARIKGMVVRTPTLMSKTLSGLTGANVWVKFENLQFTASYKERGALNKLLLMPEEKRSKGVIAASAGNHAQGIAYHSNRLGIPATIVMPRHTPIVKVMQTEGHGAQVILHGDSFDEAYARACELAEEKGYTFAHPFDDAEIIAGQGSVALELLEDAPDIDTLVVPIGGGGLISGMATVVKELNPSIEVVGAQARLYPSAYCAFKNEKLPSSGDTLAEGIAVKEPGKVTTPIIRELVDDVVLVPERNIETAVSLLLQIEKTVAEGAGAVGLAALMAAQDRFRGKTVGLVITGGNIDTRLLATVLLRDLARSGRMARLRIVLHDRPGSLFGVVRLFDKHQINIVETYHQRVFTSLPAKDTFIDIECEARDREHIQRLVDDLELSGFKVHPVDIH